jgi:hypothetical protein
MNNISVDSMVVLEKETYYKFLYIQSETPAMNNISVDSVVVLEKGKSHIG